MLNRVNPWTSLTTVPTVSPELSRSRAQRLASVRSHGCVNRSKRRPRSFRGSSLGVVTAAVTGSRADFVWWV